MTPHPTADKANPADPPDPPPDPPAGEPDATPTPTLPPYPAYKPSGIAWLGDVPERWEVRRLKHVTSTNPEDLPETTDPEHELQYVDIGDVDATAGITGTTTYRFVDAPSRARRVVRDGDVIISTVRTYLKAVAGVVKPADNLIVSTGFAVVRPSREVHPPFLRHMLSSDGFIGSVVARSVGVSYPAIAPSTLSNLPIPLPPLAEQRGIAGFLDRATARVDALVAKKRRLLGLLAEKRQALITHAVTRGLDPHAPTRPTHIAWLGDVPGHWEVMPIRRIISRVTSGSRGWAAHYADEGTPFVRIGNIARDRIDLRLEDLQCVDAPQDEESRRTSIRVDDVLLSITAYIGAVGVANDAVVPGHVNQHIALISPIHDAVESRWLAYALLSEIGQFQCRVSLSGGTKEGLTLDDVKSLCVCLPPPDEQRWIVAHLDAATARLDGLSAQVAAAIARLAEYRAALITAAVTGRVDVRAVFGQDGAA